MRRVAFIAIGLLSCTAAVAEGGPLGAEARTWLEVQAFAPRVRTDLRIDNDAFGATAGSQIQAEDELHLPRRGTATGLVFGRRIGERWRFEADYLTLQRDGDALLSRNLQVGGWTYAAGSALHTRLRLQFARFNAGVSLLQSEQAEFGLAFGGALSRFRLDIDDGTTGEISWASSEAMPLVGVYFSAALAPGWRVSGRLDAAKGNGSETTRVSLDAVWQATPWLALGAGLRWMDGHHVADHNDLLTFDSKRLEFRLAGPQLYAAFTF